MAGILDYQRNPSILSPTVDGTMPSLPKQGGGMFGWFNDDPGATSGTSTARAPLTGNQKQSLLFSGISDAIDSLHGRDGDLTQQMSKQYQQDYTKQSAEKRKVAVNKAISDAYATGDMNAVRQAILQADPADVAHIHEAFQIGQPKVDQVDPTKDTVSTDPLTGARTVISKGVPKPHAPPTRTYQNGTQSITEVQDPQTGVWTQLGAGPKFAPQAGPKPPKPSIAIPHPGSMY